MSKYITYCGFVSIVGRPNVGKSTLLNCLIGQKISIISHKPQTTRNCILGIHTEGMHQIIYIDTPGFDLSKTRVINNLMNKAVNSSMYNVELIIFVIDSKYWTFNDEIVLKKLLKNKTPIVLVMNKIDTINDKSILLPQIKFLSKKMNFLDIIPVSAKYNDNINYIKSISRDNLKQSEHYFPADHITNRSRKFIASEIIREQIIYYLGAELPYSIAVIIEYFIVKCCGSYDINGLILVERDTQKKIVIGNKGNKIKEIGIQARKNIEDIFMVKVNLKLWVKVKSGWADNQSILRSLGYYDN